MRQNSDSIFFKSGIELKSKPVEARIMRSIGEEPLRCFRRTMEEVPMTKLADMLCLGPGDIFQLCLSNHGSSTQWSLWRRSVRLFVSLCSVRLMPRLAISHLNFPKLGTNPHHHGERSWLICLEGRDRRSRSKVKVTVQVLSQNPYGVWHVGNGQHSVLYDMLQTIFFSLGV